jgi:hypothetical protein
VDPGIAAMGVLRMDGGRIAGARTYKTPAVGPHPLFEETLERAAVQAGRVKSEADEWGAAVVVLEAYEDFGGRYKRSVRNRWMTPLLLGMIAVTVEQPCVWQGAGAVLTAYGPHKRMWAAGHTGIIEGDELLGTDHERSAACHALAYLAHRTVVE